MQNEKEEVAIVKLKETASKTRERTWDAIRCQDAEEVLLEKKRIRERARIRTLIKRKDGPEVLLRIQKAADEGGWNIRLFMAGDERVKAEILADYLRVRGFVVRCSHGNGFCIPMFIQW